MIYYYSDIILIINLELNFLNDHQLLTNKPFSQLVKKFKNQVKQIIYTFYIFMYII